MSGPGDVPPEILDRLRPICRSLPDAHEEPAWIGVRWRIRARTFAHVYMPDVERFPVYAQHVTDGEPPTVMTFRVPPEDMPGLAFPYFRAPWGHHVAAAILGEHTDWTEIAEMVTDSYCEMAPKFLAARLSGVAARRAVTDHP
jgi:YjbR protein